MQRICFYLGTSQSQAELSPCVLQYGKKKLKYLPYNHQHEYFFLSEYPPFSLPFSWNATCPFQPSMCEQSNSSNPSSSRPSFLRTLCSSQNQLRDVQAPGTLPCRARECKAAEARNNLQRLHGKTARSQFHGSSPSRHTPSHPSNGQTISLCLAVFPPLLIPVYFQIQIISTMIRRRFWAVSETFPPSLWGLAGNRSREGGQGAGRNYPVFPTCPARTRYPRWAK